MHVLYCTVYCKDSKWILNKYSLKNPVFVHLLLYVIFVLHKLAHGFFALNAEEELRVHEGWTQDVDPHTVLAKF